MAYTDIDKPSDYFNTKLYTGNGSTNAITGVGFQPDWVWIKDRDNANDHKLYDGVRGATKYLISNSTAAEATQANGLTSFDSDGFTLGSYGGTNGSGGGSGPNFVSWNWLASNTTASNTDGDITSTVSANTTSGFSIVSYTGTANSSDTVGHGLGAVPKMIIIKRRDDAGGTNWCVYHVSNNNTKVMFLESTSAGISNIRYWNNTTPTSSVFSIGNDDSLNASGGSFIAYCFAEKKGFSKFGSYTGNGSADGTFVYTGFKPAFIMVKDYTTAGNNWFIWDNKRDGYNVINRYLRPNLSDAEGYYEAIDILSNGFKNRNTSGSANGSGTGYIYMAFAENPFVTSGGIPTTAR